MEALNDVSLSFLERDIVYHWQEEAYIQTGSGTIY